MSWRWFRFLYLFFMVFHLSESAYGFEDTKVLPEGVRNIKLRRVEARFDQKFDSSGSKFSLGKALSKPLTAQTMVDGVDRVKGIQLNSAIQQTFGSMTPLSSVDFGRFSADIKGSVNVSVPIFSYGITDRFTLGMAIPLYQARSAMDVGFIANKENIQKFSSALRLQGMRGSAESFEQKMANASELLHQKFAALGYGKLENWSQDGLGDLIIAGKGLFWEQGMLSLATKNGVVLPTGKLADPSIPHSIPFGDGVGKLFGSIIFDQVPVDGLRFNQYAKLTQSLPGKKKIRMGTVEQPLSNKEQEAEFLLGALGEVGLSMQYASSYGVEGGVGYLYEQKGKDSYKVGGRRDVVEKLEMDTNTRLHSALVQVGFSTIELYKRGSAPLPAAARVSYQQPLAGRNSPVKSQMSFDVDVYF